MTIDKAIALLHSLQGQTPEQLGTVMQQAISLSLEALERIKWMRETPGSHDIDMLPSETKE